MACSPCLSAVGFTPGCERSPAGVRTTVFLLPFCQLDSYITAYGGIVDTITPELGGLFLEVTARQQTVNFQEPPNGSTGSLLPQLTFVIESLSSNPDPDAARQEALDFYNSILANDTGFVAVFTEANGRRRVAGLNGGLVYSDGTTADTGTARTDQPATTIVLQGSEPRPAPVLASTYVIPVA